MVVLRGTLEETIEHCELFLAMMKASNAVLARTECTAEEKETALLALGFSGWMAHYHSANSVQFFHPLDIEDVVREIAELRSYLDPLELDLKT